MNEALSDEFLSRLTALDSGATDLFVRHFGRVLKIKLRARRLPPGLAEEICQETITRVLDALHSQSITDVGKLSAYVNGTCNHVLAEHFRRESRFRPLEPDFERRDGGVGSEQKLLLQENERHVKAVLDELTGRDRQILVALFYEERDKEAICQQLGVDRGYLRVLVHRAKAAFLARLSG